MKKRSTWIITVLLIIAVIMFAGACKKEAAPATGETAAAPVVKKAGDGMYFRLVTHGGDDPFWAVVQQGMRDAADELGCKADIALSGGDLAKQLKDFQEAVASKPDGIALVINDATAWDKPVADAIAAGIPVIGINNDDPDNPRLCYIGQSETVAAYKLAKKVFETAKEKGVNFAKAHVGFAAEVPGATYAQVRAQGVKNAMAEYGIKSFEMIDAGGLEATTVESRITAYLTSHPETTFIMGAGGICTDRLMSSLKAAGKNPGEVYAGGFDAAPATLEGLSTGYLIASIDQQQYLQGYLAIYAMYLYKKYGLTPNVDTGGYLITPDKVDMIKGLSGKYR
jgi:simple sugar transport system substrate-binding protein